MRYAWKTGVAEPMKTSREESVHLPVYALLAAAFLHQEADQWPARREEWHEEELHPTGKKIFYGRVIPYRGAWLEFKYDLTETVTAYVDRRRNFPATQILRILGFSEDSQIFAAFGKEHPEIINTLKKDYTKNKEEAYLDFYRKMRPTEPVTKEAAEGLFYRLFFDPARYDLERAGRFILNRKLGMDVSLEKRILDSDTVIKVIEYLIKLNAGTGKIDDIDHLGNRRCFYW